MPESDKHDADQFKLTIGVLGLEKLWTPTFHYLGEQLKDFVKWLVDTRLKKSKERTREDNFHQINRIYFYYSLPPIEVTDLIVGDGFAAIDPFTRHPNWDWPLLGLEKHEQLDRLLPPRSDLNCDRSIFINLLCQSLSLNKVEKLRVLHAWPTLSQYQVNELINVFNEEREEFQRLLPREAKEIWRLVFTAQRTWGEIVLDDPIAGTEAFLLPALAGNHLFPYFQLWSEFYILAGKVLAFELRSYREACQAFSLGLRLDTGSLYAMHAMGWCLVRIQRFSAAIPFYEHVVKNAPKAFGPRLDLVELYLLTDNYPDCRSEITRAKDVGAANPRYEIVLLALEHILTCIESLTVKAGVSTRLNDLLTQGVEHDFNFVDIKRHLKSIDGVSSECKKHLDRFTASLIALEIMDA